MIEAEWLSSTDPAAMLAHVQETVSSRKLRLFSCACCRAVWDGTPCERCRERRTIALHNNAKPPFCSACNGSGRTVGLTDPRSRRAVEVAEAFAEGWATKDDRLAAMDSLPLLNSGLGRESQLVANCLFPDGWHQWSVISELAANAWDLSLTVQADLLRSIVGNPFQRPPKWKFCPGDATTWCTPNVLSLAAAIQGGEPCPACGGWKTYYGSSLSCPACGGSGRTPFVTDPAAWAVLGDALEEAGCTDAAILNHCRGPALVPHVRGDWVIDLLTGKE